MCSCTGDSFRDHVRRGNRSYEAAVDTLNEDSTLFYDAATEYERAISKDASKALAHFNVGNAYLMTEQDSAAFHEYMVADSLESDFDRQAHIHRNIGVMLEAQALNAPDSVKYQLLKGAVDNYKASLRFDPHNDETRYNLALCQWQLKQNQNNDNGGCGGQSEDKEDQQQQQEEQKQQEQEQQQQQQATEQMINAAMQREKETQNRMNQYEQNKREQEERQNAAPRKLQKNW